MAQEEVVVEKILKSYPQVDLVFGTHNLWRLPELLANVGKVSAAINIKIIEIT